MKKEWKLLSPYFYFLMAVDILLVLLDIGARILYVCNKVAWLKWSIKSTSATALGLLLMLGFPWWLGARCESCSRRNVFLFGMLFNLGTGLVGIIAATLQWQFFLIRCLPAIYATPGGRQSMIISWLVFPIDVLLGGVAALMGYNNRKKKSAKSNVGSG